MKRQGSDAGNKGQGYGAEDSRGLWEVGNQAEFEGSYKTLHLLRSSQLLKG